MRASECDLSSIINTIPMLAWSARPDGFCDFLNQRWLDFTGLSAEQARGSGWGATIHPDDAKGLLDSWQMALVTGQLADVEARMRRFDGEYRWFLLRASPLRDESGKIVKWYGTNTDIDDRKRAEEELRRSEAFLAEGQRLSLSGSFLWRLDTDEITFSEQLYRIHEFDRDSPVTLERIRSRIHPEDLPLLSEKIEAGAGRRQQRPQLRDQVADAKRFSQVPAHDRPWDPRPRWPARDYRCGSGRDRAPALGGGT